MKRLGDRPIDYQASLYNIFLLTIFTYHSKVAMSCGWSWWVISFTRPSWMTWLAIGARDLHNGAASFKVQRPGRLVTGREGLGVVYHFYVCHFQNLTLLIRHVFI